MASRPVSALSIATASAKDFSALARSPSATLRVADLDPADGDVVAPFEIARIGGGQRNGGRLAVAVSLQRVGVVTLGGKRVAEPLLAQRIVALQQRVVGVLGREASREGAGRVEFGRGGVGRFLLQQHVADIAMGDGEAVARRCVVRRGVGERLGDLQRVAVEREGRLEVAAGAFRSAPRSWRISAWSRANCGSAAPRAIAASTVVRARP